MCALLAAAALCGCGAGDGGGEGARAMTLAATQTRTPAARATDRAIAENAIPTLADFPSGWTEADSSRRLKVKCPATTAARSHASGIAISPAFSKGENTQAVTAVYVFAREAAAARAFKEISSHTTRRCYADSVAKALSATNRIEVRHVTTARVSLRPLGDQRAAGRITIAVTSAGVDADLDIDLVFVRADRGLSLGLFIDALSPFDKQLRAALTAKQVRRLSAGLG